MYYSDAVLKLDGRDARKIANNTYLERDTVGTDIYVRLHSTRIIAFHEDGTVTYKTGGWHTKTTKERFNSFGANGLTVYSHKREWHVWDRNTDTHFPFFDGMRIDPYDKNTFPTMGDHIEQFSRREA